MDKDILKACLILLGILDFVLCKANLDVDECKEYSELNDADRSVTNYAAYDRRCDDELNIGWYRFTGKAGRVMPTKCVAKFHCGAYGPGWLDGDHPRSQDGRVNRRVCFHLDGECCKEELTVHVRNCGRFMVYYLPPPSRCPLKYCGSEMKELAPTTMSPRPLTFKSTQRSTSSSTIFQSLTSPTWPLITPPVPHECESYRVLNETDRARAFYYPFQSLTDEGLTPGWYRFMGKAGSRMAHKCVKLFHCGTHAPGWLNGAHPLITEGAVTRQVCFHWNGDCCYFKQQILVRNCGDFYVYELPGLEKSFLRYCGNSKKHHHLGL